MTDNNKKKSITKKASSYVEIKPEHKGPFTTIYLVRHCNPEYKLQKKLGDFNMPLSKLGLRQRKYLEKRLSKININKIYSSQLTRAYQTAEHFAKKMKKDVTVDERFNEINWSHWHKIKYFKMSERIRDRKKRNHQKLDKELDVFQSQARKALADIYNKNKGKKVIIFCHGNIIRCVLTGILNADVVGFLSFEIYQSSVSKLVIDRDGYIKINYMNNISHLPHDLDKDILRKAIAQ